VISSSRVSIASSDVEVASIGSVDAGSSMINPQVDSMYVCSVLNPKCRNNDNLLWSTTHVVMIIFVPASNGMKEKRIEKHSLMQNPYPYRTPKANVHERKF
jgi:hypothetical protein